MKYPTDWHWTKEDRNFTPRFYNGSIVNGADYTINESFGSCSLWRITFRFEDGQSLELIPYLK